MHRPHRDPITRDAFVDALRQRGLADFDGLVEHCLRLRAPAVTTPVAPVGRAELVERFFGEEARTRAKATARRPPRLPFVVGDEIFAPEEIGRFDGRVLQFSWDRKLAAHGLLRAITTAAELFDSLADERPEGYHVELPFPLPHLFFEHIAFGGRVLVRGADSGMNDLTWERINADQILYAFDWRYWDNTISSLWTSRGHVWLFDKHVWDPTEGTALHIPPHTMIPWIGHAWNDVVSTIYCVEVSP